MVFFFSCETFQWIDHKIFLKLCDRKTKSFHWEQAHQQTKGSIFFWKISLPEPSIFLLQLDWWLGRPCIFIQWFFFVILGISFVPFNCCLPCFCGSHFFLFLDLFFHFSEHMPTVWVKRKLDFWVFFFSGGGRCCCVVCEFLVPQWVFEPRPSALTEKAMAPHSSTLAWKIPWMEEPGRLQSMGSRRVGHDWATSLSLFTLCIGERNGNPLQCSCLENPRDCGAWWAAVSGVAQSRTRLKWLSSSSSSLCTEMVRS